MDSFDQSDTYKKIHRKLIESYALDAVDSGNSEHKYDCSESSACNFVELFGAAQMDTNPGVSLGTDTRVSTEQINGCALTHERSVIHLSVFTRVRDEQRSSSSRMDRFSSRRSRRSQ